MDDAILVVTRSGDTTRDTRPASLALRIWCWPQCISPSERLLGELGMQYVRMYADLNGRSHFEDVPVDLKLGDYSPPTPPVFISQFMTAGQFGFLSAPAGWVGEWHPVPGRQAFFYLAGEMEVQVSDNEASISSWRVLLAEDTVGRGHRSRLVSKEDVITAAVHLPE
jgi:hypothetical protein